jgi:GTP-binding protein EngB required for normal cell division
MDDGVRPQTKEALKIAKDAGSSIIIALNKVDKVPEADRKSTRSRILAQLVDLVSSIVVEVIVLFGNLMYIGTSLCARVCVSDMLLVAAHRFARMLVLCALYVINISSLYR